MNGPQKILPALSREEELILCCARTQLGPGDRECLSPLLSNPLDWKRIMVIAILHRLRPLLYKHFKAENKFHFVPPEYAASIQRHATFTVGRNLSLSTELIKLLKLFAAEKIDVIPFKGPVLALRTYHNLALREFYDMDFLLRREDIARARELLHRNGYTSPPEQNDQHIDTQLGNDFTSANGKVRLELHWSFIQKWLTYNVDIDAIWNNTEQWKLSDLPVRLIHRDDLLLYLCAHGAKHHWERLFWIIDVAELLSSEKDWNWPVVFNRAKTQRSYSALLLGLHLANSLLDSPIPIEIPPHIHQLGRQIGTWLFREEKRVKSGDWEETKFYLRVKDNFGDRLTYATHLGKIFLGPSEKDRAFIKLPEPLSFLYPAIRPVRWLVQRR